MDHWDEVLPGKVLRVQYEDVVADTETQVRRVLDYLDLPFEEACVEFHKTERLSKRHLVQCLTVIRFNSLLVPRKLSCVP